MSRGTLLFLAFVLAIVSFGAAYMIPSMMYAEDMALEEAGLTPPAPSAPPPPAGATAPVAGSTGAPGLPPGWVDNGDGTYDYSGPLGNLQGVPEEQLPQALAMHRQAAPFMQQMQSLQTLFIPLAILAGLISILSVAAMCKVWDKANEA